MPGQSEEWQTGLDFLMKNRPREKAGTHSVRFRTGFSVSAARQRSLKFTGDCCAKVGRWAVFHPVLAAPCEVGSRVAAEHVRRPANRFRHPLSSDLREGSPDSATLVRGRDDFGHFQLEPAPESDFHPDAVAFHARIMEANRKILYGSK